MENIRDQCLTYLETECSAVRVDPHLVDAIIHAESVWNPWAMRYERGWTYYHAVEKCAKRIGISKDTETTCQKISWGLGQIMGGTARDLGYTGPLSQLCDPRINIRYICAYFNRFCSEYLKIQDKIAAYNAGSVKKLTNGDYSNQAYVTNVMQIYINLAGYWRKRSAPTV